VEQVTGVVDSGTTYKLYYTETEREKILSFLQLSKQNINVPVGARLYPQIQVCPSDCTKRMGDVTVKSVGFHMHAWGRMIALRHIRDGKELEPLAM